MGIIRRIAFETGKALFGVDGDIDIDNDFDDTDDSAFIDFDDDTTIGEDVLDIDDVPDEYNISFQKAPNRGSFIDSGKDVTINVAGGNSKGSYDVFYHDGQKYIDFKDQWIKIEGKDRFSLNGNTYIIKKN